MRIVKLLGALVAVVLVHLVGQRLSPSFARYVDVFLVVLVLYALEGESLPALLVGLVLGLLEDALAKTGHLGLFGFSDTLVAYATARLAQRLVIQRATGVLAVVAFAALLQQAVAVTLKLLLLPDPSLPDPVAVLIKAAACGVLGMAIHIAWNRWQNLSEVRRRGRMGRLRMG